MVGKLNDIDLVDVKMLIEIAVRKPLGTGSLYSTHPVHYLKNKKKES